MIKWHVYNGLNLMYLTKISTEGNTAYWLVYGYISYYLDITKRTVRIEFVSEMLYQTIQLIHSDIPYDDVA